MREWQMALVIPLAMLRLWQWLRRMAARLSINQIECGDIQRGRGGRFRLGVTGSRVLRI